MTIKKIFSVFLSTAAVLVFSGCSGGSGGSTVISKAFDGTELIPSGMTEICIAEIKNGSGRGDIPALLTTELKNRMNSEGRLRLISRTDSCDIKLWITLLPMVSANYSFNAAGVPEKKRVRIDALVTLSHAVTGETVIKDRGTYAEFIYADTGSDSISEYRRITGLTGKLAERIISVITTGWFRDNERKNPGR